MDIQDALEYADRVVFEKTGKHLDDLQASVIIGAIQRQKYDDIAKSMQVSLGYVKDVGYELWSMLSEHFGEEVNKSNLGATLLRKGIINQTINVFGNIGDGGMTGSIIESFNGDPKNYSERSNNRDSISSNSEISQKIQKLKDAGLNDWQIALALDLTVEMIREILSPKSKNLDNAQ
jgi:hypothetical protein